MDKFTGFMPLSGAPTTLEDRAFRACLAALGIQIETHRSAADTQRRDGIALQLRIGLNSGEVIAGEIGSGTAGYTAVCEQAGMAQGMESVAPPGGVMLSESTVRLIESAAVLGDPELVHIKGSDYPVPGRRFIDVAAQRGATGRHESTLVRRTWEMNTISGSLDEAIGGAGQHRVRLAPAATCTGFWDKSAFHLHSQSRYGRLHAVTFEIWELRVTRYVAE